MAGYFPFVGRVDDRFKCGGGSIWPGEVEAVLGRHPAVQEAVVVALEDALMGAVPVAFVVLRPGCAADGAGLRAFVLAQAAAYQHPRRVWFRDAMPLAGRGKVDRAALSAEAMRLVGRVEVGGEMLA